MNTTKTLAERVTEFQEGFADETKLIAFQSKKLSATKRETTYGMIQQGYCIAQELMLPESQQAVDELLATHGLTRDKRKGTNPWMAVTNLLFGRWKTTSKGLTYFEADKSAKKYAASFRYFHDEKWDAETIAFELGRFTSKKCGKGLVATERLDREKHRAKDPDDIRVQVNRDWLWNNGTALATIPIEKLTPRAREEFEYVAFWGVRDGTDINIFGELVGTQYSQAITAFLNRAVTELTAYAMKTFVKNKAVGKGNMKPRLVAENILKAFEEEYRKRLAEAAIAGGKKHPQAGDLTLFQVPKDADDAPEKPAKRKSVKVGGKVQVEKREAAHATA